MILNSIFLALEYREFSQDLKLRVKDQSRHITYYLQRRLKELKFQSKDFNRIVIELSETQAEQVYINSESVASITSKFKLYELLAKSDREIQDYYKSNIENGLTLLGKVHPIPLDELLLWLDELKSMKYKNEWIYQEKNFRPFNIKAELKCSLNMQDFKLSLNIKKNNDVVLSEIILQTSPDEVAFHYKFKDLILDAGNLIITSRIKGDKALFSLPLSKLE